MSDNIYKERLQLALEAAGLDLWENDLISGEVTHSASKVFGELGYSSEDNLGSVADLMGLVHPDDMPVLLQALNEHINNVTSEYRCEFRLRAKSGGWLWYANYGKIMDRSEIQPGHRFIGVTFNIHQRKSKENELAEMNQKLAEQNAQLAYMNKLLLQKELLLENAQQVAQLGTYELDLRTENIVPSKLLEKILGLDELTERSMKGFKQILHPEDCEKVLNYLARVIAQKDSFDYEYRIIRPIDQTVIWVHGLGQLQFDEQGVAIGLLGTVQDVTKRRIYESELQIAATAFESQEGIIIVDAQCIVQRVNRAYVAITGFDAHEILGQHSRIFKSGLQTKQFYVDMWAQINRMGKWSGEVKNRRKNGEIYPVVLTISAVKDNRGHVTNYVATLSDITASKKAAEEIQQLAFYDQLTNLPNRRLLMDRLQHAIHFCERSQKQGALFFIDLDNFKTLNDTLGHDKGDLLLQQVAHRLCSCVRKGDTVARLGGDEFVVLLENLPGNPRETISTIKLLAQTMLELLNQPYQLEGHEFFNSPSIGIATFQSSAQSCDELMKQADIAMYQAKKSGRNTLKFFDPLMQEAISKRALLENEIRQAYEQHQFVLYYQPQVNQLKQIIGAEVLIRWRHPERDILPPSEFISLLEESSLIFPLGNWILEQACIQLKKWQKNTDTRDLTLSINVSAKQFQQQEFSYQLTQLINKYDLNPECLKLELTETILLENFDHTRATMQALKRLGVQFSLDDFGTGYSSIQYLKHLPLDQIKIDQSFVRDLEQDNNDRVIVNVIIAMAQQFNFDVIAEGVENEQQMQLLLNSGCSSFQGYLFGCPETVTQFEKRLSETTRVAYDELDHLINCANVSAS